MEMLRVAGMDDVVVHRWHVEFERRAPEGHQNFLVFLGITGRRVVKIRARSWLG
ncbi:MAG: hypothetical protein M2R45_00640 [Verrucomicrobia subdivision 3 bacterium]|nr:hypothetical protein [Limisphaerales bacterium]MCS1414477.1 hypothetical protein [Limisphaerales bacterium]